MALLIILGCWLALSVLAATVWAAAGGLVADPPPAAASEQRVPTAVPDETAPATGTPRAG